METNGWSAGSKDGKDASAQNGSTNTGIATGSQGSGTAGSKFLSGGLGNIYTRTIKGYGGYGCGVANDDNIGYGGGYTIGTTSAPAYSYYNGTGERIDGYNEGEGQVIITIL